MDVNARIRDSEYQEEQMTYSFDQFLADHTIYRQSYEKLAAADAMLAQSARTVIDINGREVGSIAEPILVWTALHYGPDFIARYVERVSGLNRLQERFETAPSPRTLGDSTVKIDRENYDLALLLSLIYSNHRFEILQALKQFLKFVYKRTGRLASVGVGTGYELHVISTILHAWAIEGYDLDDEARGHAGRLLSHFEPGNNLKLNKLFPLNSIDENFRSRFDAIVMCELLEHLTDPFGAMDTARHYLAANGHMFVTMAINMAQEDHVFLYPTVNVCRGQLLRAKLSIVREWLIPVVVHPSQLRRRSELKKGNYAAIVSA